MNIPLFPLLHLSFLICLEMIRFGIIPNSHLLLSDFSNCHASGLTSEKQRYHPSFTSPLKVPFHHHSNPISNCLGENCDDQRFALLHSQLLFMYNHTFTYICLDVFFLFQRQGPCSIGHVFDTIQTKFETRPCNFLAEKPLVTYNLKNVLMCKLRIIPI